MTTATTVKFFQCGGCDNYHPLGFTDDCRDNANRFAPNELNAQYGGEGWEEVDEDADSLVELSPSQEADLREQFAARRQ